MYTEDDHDPIYYDEPGPLTGAITACAILGLIVAVIVAIVVNADALDHYIEKLIR